MLFNLPKFTAMLEKQNGLFSHRSNISERLRDATSHLRTLRIQENDWRNRYRNREIPKELEIKIREEVETIEKLEATFEQVNQACDEHGHIVAKCEEFLRDHGVKVPSPTFETTGVGGHNFIGNPGGAS